MPKQDQVGALVQFVNAVMRSLVRAGVRVATFAIACKTPRLVLVGSHLRIALRGNIFGGPGWSAQRLAPATPWG